MILLKNCFTSKDRVKPVLATTFEQWPPVNKYQPDAQCFNINRKNLRNNFWIITTFEKQPLFLSPTGSRCTQVWLYFKFSQFLRHIKQDFSHLTTKFNSIQYTNLVCAQPDTINDLWRFSLNIENCSNLNLNAMP